MGAGMAAEPVKQKRDVMGCALALMIPLTIVVLLAFWVHSTVTAPDPVEQDRKGGTYTVCQDYAWAAGYYRDEDWNFGDYYVEEMREDLRFKTIEQVVRDAIYDVDLTNSDDVVANADTVNKTCASVGGNTPP